MHNSVFDGDLKKQGSKSLKLNKKNLGFLAFAIVILQVADAGTLWLVGGSTATYGDYGFYGDTFMYAAVVFIISKVIYTKYFLNSAKVSAEEKSSADEVPEDTEAEDQPATKVVDTLRTRRPQEFAPRHAKTDAPVGADSKWVPKWLKASLPKRLNAKAKKFVPVGPSNTLDSEAPVFLPTAHVKEENKLLKSEYGGEDAGAIMYRSRHWLKEICPETTKANEGQKKSRSPEHKKKVPEVVLSKNARKGSRSPEPAPKKKWQEKVNPKDIKWASAWSTFQTVAAF